jgi:Pyridoxamine 5'-phosphate oxidase
MGEEPHARIRSGPWSVAEIRQFLHDTVIPVRLASHGTFPLVQSLWFLPDGLDLWCATQADSVLARRLRADDRCGFEVSADDPPYRGVRGTGHASLLPEAAAGTLPRLIQRYHVADDSPLATWLLSRIDSEVAVRIRPRTLSSWDYSPRM